METLGQTLHRIAQPTGGSNGEPLTDEEIARRTALYFKKRDGIYCPRCSNTHTLSKKEWRAAEPPWEGGSWDYIYAGPCPDCGGERDPDEVFKRRLRSAGIDSSWWQAFTFVAYDEQRQPEMAHVYRQVFAWAQRPAGTLVLHGGVGVGKTHLARAAAIEVVRAGLHVRYAEVEGLLARLRRSVGEGNYSEVHASWVEEPNVLFLDDYGAEYRTEYGEATSENLIAWRLSRERPMLITTNLGPIDPAHPELRHIPDRLASRFRDQGQVTLLRCNGSDMRPTNEPRGEKDDTIIEVKETGL